MKCENNLCIYESDGDCTLTEIYIDSLGMCTECIRAAIDENILREAKTKRRDNINAQHGVR